MFRIGVVITALAWLALPACEAGAQAVKINAAPVRLKAPVIENPPPVQLGAALQNQQNLSNAGVQTNIRHRRDRLQRKSSPGQSKTD
jgi:hypothetical protein